ncbi:MAG: hypothetical protein Q8Q15_00675 [bacterium]|nr:hypothetical protein [bacterium]
MKHPIKKISKRRKLVLPTVFLIIILSVVGLNVLGKLSFDLNLNFLGDNKMASPESNSSQNSVLQDQLGKYGLSAKDLKISEDMAEANVSGVKVLFNLEGDVQEQVVSLQFILSRAKMDGKLPKVIDLRFAKPVVSY